MIPTIEDIMRMLAAGDCSLEQALAWLAEHRKMDGMRDAEDRRMFAAMAMQGILANPSEQMSRWDEEKVAFSAIQHADALLAALAEPDEESKNWDSTRLLDTLENFRVRLTGARERGGTLEPHEIEMMLRRITEEIARRRQ